MSRFKEYQESLRRMDMKASWNFLRFLEKSSFSEFQHLVDQYMELARFLQHDYHYYEDPDKRKYLQKSLSLSSWQSEVPNEFFENTYRMYSLEITEEMLENTDWEAIPSVLQLMPSLRAVDMTNLELQDVDNVLGSFSNIEEIELPGNLLDTVPESIKAFSALLALNLGRNLISDFSGCDLCWPSLKKLEIHRNKISFFSPGILAHSNLEHLNMSGNDIRSLPEQGHEKIKWLNIAYNSIQDIRVLEKYHNLEFLGVTGNPLTDFPPIPGLKSLEISSDQFDKMIPASNEMKQLETLRIEGNGGNLDIAGIENLSSLSELSIENVSIKNLERLGALPSLKKLNLSYATINGLPHEIFVLGNLTELRVPGNKLSEVPDKFDQLKHLKLVSIENNQLKKLPDTLLKANLNFIYASGNQFSILERGRIDRNRGSTLIYF